LHYAINVPQLVWQLTYFLKVAVTNTVHNPAQYMFDFKHIISHGRKKIGILIGAGAPVSVNIDKTGGYEPLIPNVAGLTERI